MAKFKGVAFDLDGVITDTAVFHAKAWQKLCDKLGITWNEAMANGTKGVSRYDSLMVILKEGGKENEFSEAEIEELLTEKNDLYKQMIEELTPSDILPGIKKLLTDLKANNYPIILASASHNAPNILKHLEIEQMFDGIVDPASLEKGKPAPDIYLKAAELMNVAPSEMLGVEDAKAGVEAIKAAGSMAVGIGDSTILSDADIVVDNTDKLTLAMLEEKFS